MEWFYEDLQDLLELTSKKDVLFIIGDWNAKVEIQEIPGVTAWSMAKANRVLPRERTDHGKHPLSTTQEKTLYMEITIWSILTSDWIYSLQPKMERLSTVSKNKTGSWLWLRSWTPYCQIQTWIEERGKTTRPFGYDLNQIPYNYTVEVTKRFKGVDLIDRVPEVLWMEVRDIVQGAVIKTIPKKKKCKKAMVVWGDLTNSWEKKRKAKEKRKDMFCRHC